MDDSVIRAMIRWPNVPGVFGYLGLDLRGQWQLRGHRLENPKIVSFINRNYGQDAHGRWFFQNGPQRAYVTLCYTPWVYRLRDGAVNTHTGLQTRSIESAWLDEDDRLMLQTDLGIGLLHDQDLPEAVDRLVDADGGQLGEQQVLDALARIHSSGVGPLYLLLDNQPVPLSTIRSSDVAARFRFDPSPMPRPEEADLAQVAAL